MTAQYDFEFRPDSYWSDADVPRSRVARVKGQDLQESAKKLVGSGRGEELADPEYDASLPDRDREFRGRVHPRLMGGEYLPDFAAQEVEIARVSLASVTGDVISIRARAEGGSLWCRVVDEYDTVFTWTPSESDAPLTMGELVRLTGEGIYPEGGVGSPVCYAIRSLMVTIPTKPSNSCGSLSTEGVGEHQCGDDQAESSGQSKPQDDYRQREHRQHWSGRVAHMQAH